MESMSMRGFVAGLAVLMLACSGWAVAEETVDVELRRGYVDPGSGVKVEDIVVLPRQSLKAVHLAIPRNGEPIEELVVTARRRSGKRVLQLKPHEFVRDYDNDYYGLVIYLGRDETRPLRLYLDAAQQRPGVVTP